VRMMCKKKQQQQQRNDHERYHHKGRERERGREIWFGVSWFETSGLFLLAMSEVLLDGKWWLEHREEKWTLRSIWVCYLGLCPSMTRLDLSWSASAEVCMAPFLVG